MIIIVIIITTTIIMAIVIFVVIITMVIIINIIIIITTIIIVITINDTHIILQGKPLVERYLNNTSTIICTHTRDKVWPCQRFASRLAGDSVPRSSSTGVLQMWRTTWQVLNDP